MIQPLLMFCLMLLSPMSFAGIEVPWPLDAQRDVYIRDMQGTWVSINLNAPQRIFNIKVEVANNVLSCPYIVYFSEIDPFNGKVITEDRDVFCSSFQRKVVFILADGYGQARKQVEIVGLSKPADAGYIGFQVLGISVYVYGEIQEKIYQDAFYKFSR